VLLCATVMLLGFWWLNQLDDPASNPLADLQLPADELTTDQIREPIDHLATEHLQSGENVGLVIAILKSGRSEVFGYGSLTTGGPTPPDGDTLFEIASVGKTFTTAMLSLMSEQGEVGLQSPLDELLPEKVRVPQLGGRRITLLDLATHTAGLQSLPDNFEPADELNPYRDYTVEQMYDYLASCELSAAPGTRYEYSNLGFGLLGHGLAQKAGQDYETLVIERLCTPLQMESTRMTLSEELRARLATPHDGGQAVPVWEDLTMPGAGSFLSTGNDLLKYLQAHLTDSDTPLHRALRNSTKKRRPTDSPETAIGLGWHVTSENALDIVWHNGGAGGSTSYAALLPEHGVAVVVLANSSNSVDELGRKVLYLVHRHWQVEEAEAK
jgi:CubicO group peptidase (beta-lactamase class C family)